MRGSAGSWLLAAGALAGAAMAALSIAGRGAPGSGIPDDAVAVVDGRPILRADYQRALDAVDADRRAPVDDPIRRRVLDRLIDEQLLLARGLELGLPERDPRVRAELAAAVLDLVVRGDDPAGEPVEAELRALLAAEPELFRSPPLVDVEVLFFAGEPEAARARTTGPEAARAAALPSPLPLPDGPMPAGKLRDYLGETAARAALTLAPGQLSAPLRTPSGVVILHLRGRSGGALPPFEEVRDRVAAVHRRRRAEQRLADFLAGHRAAASIAIAGDRL